MDPDQITIRPIRPDDLADYFAMITHPQVAENLMRLPSLEYAEAEAWIKEPAAGAHRLVAEMNDCVVGLVKLQQAKKACQAHAGKMALMVHPDFWGQGIGQALMGAAVDLADNWLNWLRFELEVYTQNERAIDLYQNFGFEIEGTKRRYVFGDGRYFDAQVMARLRQRQWYPPPAADKSAGSVTKRQPIRAIIRTPRYPQDLEDLYAMYRHPAVGRTTMQLPSQEIAFTQKRLENQVPGLYRYVADVDGRIAGQASLYQSQNPRAQHSAGIGMAVHPEYWGVSIGSQLMAALIQLADNWLQITRLDLEVNIDNPGGVRLYEKFGFEIEGTKQMHLYADGRMTDSYFMARLKDSR